MKIAIAGFGVEGRVNYSYFRAQFPEAEFTIVDERLSREDLPEEAEVIDGEDAFSQLEGFDLVIRTAGLSPYKIKTTGKIWSATNEFFAQCPAKIVGVTGTKGKGTTASLITNILSAAGKKVHLVGNIGVPALEVLSNIKADDIVIYELSSFQLWDIERSPSIAVVLMVEQDHLDVHIDMADYVNAKGRIARYQLSGDVIVYHPTNPYSQEIASASPARKIRYCTDDDGAAKVEANNFVVQGHAISSVDTLHLVGEHNLDNACAAITVARQLGVNDEAIREGIASFKGLDHRLKFVAEVDGVGYYDDSIATTPGSAIAALRSFDQPKIIILGGSYKGANYDEIIKVAKDTESRVVAIGQTGEVIHKLCLEHGVEVFRELGGMVDIVRTASSLARPGDVVILSPASASFDMFSSYADRGDQFVAAVESLGRS